MNGRRYKKENQGSIRSWKISVMKKNKHQEKPKIFDTEN